MKRAFEHRISRSDAINALPLYPTEKILWDENIVPTERYDGKLGSLKKCKQQHAKHLHSLYLLLLITRDFILGQTVLALPKLNLQFLAIHDYLLR